MRGSRDKGDVNRDKNKGRVRFWDYSGIGIHEIDGFLFRIRSVFRMNRIVFRSFCSR